MDNSCLKSLADNADYTENNLFNLLTDNKLRINLVNQINP